MGVDDDIVTGNNGGPWRERTNYHLTFEYDTVSGQLTFRLIRNGALVETLTGRLNHFDLSKNGKCDARRLRPDRDRRRRLLPADRLESTRT